MSQDQLITGLVSIAIIAVVGVLVIDLMKLFRKKK